MGRRFFMIIKINADTMNNYLHSEITEKIIKAYFKVYNALGFGFLEKVYERALALELAGSGLIVQQQVPIEVFYAKERMGVYFADLLINNCVIIEVKSAASLCEEHEAQLVNYLKATELEVGMLINFGQKPEFRRKVFSNELKHQRKS